eukprot:c28934_g1_i1 orf=545-1153(-)
MSFGEGKKYVIESEPLLRWIAHFGVAFITGVASLGCSVHMVHIQVEAEREQKIRTEINEIRKVFFCELCNKQYRFAMEFDAHLSSYDHSHKKRFKELRDLRTAAFRDSRLRREEVRQEREIARFAQLVKVQRAQQQGQQEAANSAITKTGTSVPVQEQRTALKFEISAKSAFSRVSPGAAVKKTKVAPRVPSVFRDGSEEDA